MSRRTEKLASTIRQVLSQAMATRLSDPRLGTMISITRVEVSEDIMHARVFVSVMGDETRERLTMTGLEHARSYLQTILAKSLTTRHCPQLRFVADRGIKKQLKTMELIDQISEELRQIDAQRQARAAEAAPASPADSPDPTGEVGDANPLSGEIA